MIRPPCRVARIPRSRRKAMTFLEILIAVTLLAGVMIPVSSMLIDTASQSAATKAESAASSYAAKLMNQFLDELAFDDAILDATGGTPHKSEDQPGGNPVIDGTAIRWDLEVAIIPDSTIFFRHRTVRYHSPSAAPPCTNGTEAKIDAGNVMTPAFSTGVNIAPANERSVADLDRKNAGRPVLKELRLTIQWKSPRDPAFEDLTQPGPRRRTVSLITRRARL